MTLEELLAVLKTLAKGFDAVVGGHVAAFEDHFSVVALDIPGNDGGVRIRIAEDVEAPEEYRFTFEAWRIDAEGRRISEVVRGNGANTPEDAMLISHWRALMDPPHIRDSVDSIVLEKRRQ